MAAFDRINGVFTTRFANGKSGITANEKFAFKRNGWKWNPKRKGWETTDIECARPLAKFAAGAAKEHLEAAERVRKAAVASSWAEDTLTDFPAPDGLAYLPFQKAGIEYAAARSKTLIADPPGLGKAQPNWSKVCTPSGWVPIGDLSEGDYVYGKDGKPTQVEAVFPQGFCDTYRVTFRDGSVTHCNLDHLWTVRGKAQRTKGKNVWTTKTTKQLIAGGLWQSQGKSKPTRKWQIPLTSPVQYPTNSHFIPPYILGIMIGDGDLCGTSPAISIADSEIFIKDQVEKTLHEEYKLCEHRTEANVVQWCITKKARSNKPNIYKNELGRLGLCILGKYKFLPKEYMMDSVENRWELLRGLMDADGSSHGRNSATFHTVSERLADDVVSLVQSLGGVGIKGISDRRHSGKSVEYNINVKVLENPFKLPRKANKWKLPKNNKACRYIDSIELVGKDNHTCISVAADDNLYLTDSYVVTHNTIQAIGVHNALETERVLVICPASLKVNWKREWEKWDVLGRSVGLAHSSTKREPIFDENGERQRDYNNKPMSRTWTEHVWPDTDVVVINYDMLDAFDSDVKDVKWDLMICDEAHLLKTKDALRTLCVFGGWRKGARKNGKQVRKPKTYTEIEAARSLFLTGTPILSKPIELWNLIRICDPKGLGKSWDDYAFDFCGAYYDGNYLDTSGASNSEMLNRLLRERFMVRRDKRAVLKELPDKTRELIMLPQDKLEAPVKRELSRMETALAAYEDLLGISETERQFRYIKAIDDLADKLQEAMDAQNSEDPNWDAAVKTLDEPDQILFTEISLAREEVALAKVGLVVDHVKKLIESEEPVILFAYHKSVVAEIQKRLEDAGIRVGIVTGAVPSKKRQQVVDDFQDGKYDVILGNILAMGVGFTLTRARFVVFAELDWVPALIEQAEDRAWRHGQVNAVLVQHLVVDGSIESRMAQSLLDKMGVIHDTLDSR